MWDEFVSHIFLGWDSWPLNWKKHDDRFWTFCFWVDVYKETAGFTNMNKAHFLPRNPHKSKKLEGYLDFLCAFQLKQRNKLPEIYVTLQGQLGPLFPDSQWMEGRQRMLTLLCKGRLGGSSSMDFWDIFLGGCLCFKIRWTFMFVTFGYMWKKVIHSQKKSNKKQFPKRKIGAFPLKNAWLF